MLGEAMHSGFWGGFLTTILFAVVVLAVLGGVFVVISLIAGTPGG
jgi:hypothetical protein